MPNAKTTMKNWILTILILTTWATFSAGQNLVPNPSFEIFSSCPTGAAELFKATPWYDPTGATSDYYNACGTGYSNVPNCSAGYQLARTGVAYAGFFGLFTYGDNYREYIQVQLNSTLQSDSCYFVEFYCNLYNLSFYSINKIGAYLSNTAITTTVLPSLVLNYTPQIISSTFLSDTLNWIHVSGYYQANGGEKYITIGNFEADNPIDTIHNPGGTHISAYYFVDDVSVAKVAGCDTFVSGISEYNNIFLRTYPNPTNQSANIEFNNIRKQNCILTLYDIRGQVVRTINNITTNKVEIERQSLANGLYFFQLHTDKHIIATGKLTFE
jgi:hypothetical protein